MGKNRSRLEHDGDDDDSSDGKCERRQMKEEERHEKKKKKKKKNVKQHTKENKRKRKRESSLASSSSSWNAEDPSDKIALEAAAKVVSTDDADDIDTNNEGITLLLFYQYVEPPWDEAQYRIAKQFVSDHGQKYHITGRIRCAREGLNCTLTGSRRNMHRWIEALRNFDGGRSTIDPKTGKATVTEFANTEFKLTHNLPNGQRFPCLNVMEVIELVNYGLAGSRAPPISKHGGQHLEPQDYHTKMSESDVVVIDVRNHYESNIGRFVPPEGGATVIDPKMRKSTEFPLWLDKPETKELLRNKQVLMYCTGGVRCERASALLKQKMDTEEDTKSLGIKGVYQLQGGIDKYFKEFPSGGMWQGKNYVFDKRFAHAPPGIVGAVVGDANNKKGDDADHTGMKARVDATDGILGKCEACSKPWDMFRGKRRCPSCGVPSLICRSCLDADKAGTKKLDKYIRCDLCVAEDIKSKRQFREKEEKEAEEYERKLRLRQQNDGRYKRNAVNPCWRDEERPDTIANRSPCPNPEGITRLFLKNMCAKRMDESTLIDFLHPAKVTHIQWLTDRSTGKFYGSAFIETSTSEDAGLALALDGHVVLGRKIKVKYQRADEKDVWPIPKTRVVSRD